MSEINAKAIRKEIKEILVGADLTQLTSKKVRKQLEQKFNIELTDRKKEIDEILMKEIEDANQNKSDGSDDSSGEEQDNTESDESSSSYEEIKKSKPKAKNPVARKRHASPVRNSKAKSKKLKSSASSEQTDKPKKKTGFSRDMALSQELTDLFGTDKLPRCDVVKKMYALFKERDLMDPSNKQFVICDEELYKIFGVKRFRAFGMMKYLKHHVKDPKLIQESR
ncbi:uncharacterized protein LOC135696540 [Rhopilema esculentum]|uniref:uncharacterized protein LOC135696540 n=1 Tax=Rhopilema esculentum TaxID=499914 RepID=UPI0031D4C22E